AAFVPDGRRAGGRELSVSLMLDNECLPRLQRNRRVAEWGVGVLAMEKLNLLIATQWRRLVLVERAPLEDEPAHANIVYLDELPTPIRNAIAASLALHAAYLPPPQR